MYTYRSIFVSALLILLPFFVDAAFERNLAEGDQGEDVRELQQILNARAETRIAESGPGSPGMETTYFGALTRAAVVRFQNLYAAEILTPLGLLNGTGFVGASTRARLTAVTALPNIGEILQTPPKITDTSYDENSAPVITSVEPAHGSAGTRVTLRGHFDPKGNSVHVPYGILEDVASDGNTLSFIVEEPFPPGLEIPEFVRITAKSLQYGFAVQNENGISNAVSFTLDL